MSREPIAIVGMACRLPGKIYSASDLWSSLLEGLSGQGEIPKSRFNKGAFYHANPQSPESINSANGYFIDGDIRAFDNQFFGIHNLEAQYMDPQQRQLLEVTFECMESAGFRHVSGQNIGCYVANFTTDFAIMQSKDPGLFHRYSGTGMGAAIMANRLSHVFDLKGPSVTIDTACSSSVYALHLACTALRNKECDGAFVGGANLIQTPELYISAVRAGMTSGTSTCHTFDLSADGYARAEGIGALYVKRLSDAIRDGDPIRSIIRGSAVNSNGKTNGISLPSAAGQEAVIRKAYADAGVMPDQTDYIEAHGTGTEVGDGIEVDAFSRVIQHKTGIPILIGAVKPNLGHSEAVSGIASVMKVTLALQHGVIPRTIGIQHLNPKLRLEERNVSVVVENIKWPETEVPRASINSFGYGGSNAHVILDGAHEHYDQEADSDAQHRDESFIIPLSAKTHPSLQARLADLAAYIDGVDTNLSVQDLAHTLSCRRTHFAHRGFIITTDQSLQADLGFRNLHERVSHNKRPEASIVFAFTGQGAQWVGMGRSLMQNSLLFSQVIQELDDHLASLPQAPAWRLQDVLSCSDSGSGVHQALISQPACTAVQIGLLKILESIHVTPIAVVGHSSGEISAAFAAGFISAEQAIAVAYYRGMLVSKHARDGAMAAIGTDPKTVTDWISASNLSESLQIACINSPTNVTVSGDIQAIDTIIANVGNKGVFVRKLQTGDKAYHSYHMVPVGRAYVDVLDRFFSRRNCVSNEKSVRMISSVFAREVQATEVASPDYWRKNLESQVHFSDALAQTLSPEICAIVEIGPHGALKGSTNDIIKSNNHQDCIYIPTMMRGQNPVTSILELVGQLFLCGVETPLETLNGSSSQPGFSNTRTHKPKVLTDLPNYKWTHGPPLWSEGRLSLEYRNRKYARHELLGSLTPGGNGETSVWRNLLKVDDVSWLRDHKLSDTLVFPAAGYITMAVEAFRQTALESRDEVNYITLKEIKFMNMLAFSNDSIAIELFTELRKMRRSLLVDSEFEYTFTISSFEGGVSTVHSRGFVTAHADIVTRTEFPEVEAEKLLEPYVWYRRMRIEALNFGPAFQRLTEIVCDGNKHNQTTVGKATMVQSDSTSSNSYLLHPTLIDSLFQASIISTAAGNPPDLKGKIPISIRSASFLHVPESSSRNDVCNIIATSHFEGIHTAVANSKLHSSRGQLLHIEGLNIVPWRRFNVDSGNLCNRQPHLDIVWQPDIAALRSAGPSELEDALEQFAEAQRLLLSTEILTKMVTIAYMHCYKSLGKLNILQLGPASTLDLEKVNELFAMGDQLKVAKSYFLGEQTPDGLVTCSVHDALSNGDNENAEVRVSSDISFSSTPKTFDIVLAPLSFKDTRDIFELSSELLSLAGTMVFACTGDIVSELRDRFWVRHSFRVTSDTFVVVANLKDGMQTDNYQKPPAILVGPLESTSPLHFTIEERLVRQIGSPIRSIAFNDICDENIPPHALILCTLEIGSPLLACMSAAVLAKLQLLAKKASAIIWLTSASQFQQSSPDFSLVRGLSRTLVLEYPALNFCVLDIGPIATIRDEERTISNMGYIIEQVTNSSQPDLEYAQKCGILHVSRFMPANVLNKIFNNRRGQHPTTLGLANAGYCKLFVRSPGLFKSLCFQSSVQACHKVSPTYIEVRVKAVSINAKDFYALKGNVNTRNATCSLDFSGVVTQVGSAISQFQSGDRVVGMAPNYFENLVQVPEWACCRLKGDEDIIALATVPIVFATAIYALQYRAQLKAGESVLIHSATGGAGIAAIQIAKLIGAKVFATVGTEAKKDFLVDQFGIPREHIFSSRNDTFLSAILDITNDEGVDVVLNSLTGDLLRASWSACAEFGRFIDISKRDCLDGGQLDMRPFTRSTTYHAFDLADLYYSKKKAQNTLWHALLEQSIDMIRSRDIQVVKPMTVFDVSQVSEAFQHFGSASRMGKIVISLENNAAQIPYLEPRYTTTFDPRKSYLLVGCLGGLGRTLSRWMVDRGARHLVFLSRSGSAHWIASQHVQLLESAGATIQVTQGDVSCLGDVERAIAQAGLPIGGVIHAAMSLNEALFDDMTIAKWDASLKPKMHGAWNLHQALLKTTPELDFFLMTSSVAGAVALATESNYCTANAYLDSLARYRRNLGLPAVSIAFGCISEIGYLHEHPEIEKMLLRKGIMSYDQEEILQIIDGALSAPKQADVLPNAHLVTGLELEGLQRVRGKGIQTHGGIGGIFDDPRASIFSNAADNLATSQEAQAEIKKLSLSWWKEQLAKSASEVATGTDASSGKLRSLVRGLIIKSLAKLLLVPEDTISGKNRLADMGMDSMLGAEFRASLFRQFSVEVPLAIILEPNMGFDALEEIIAKALVGKR